MEVQIYVPDNILTGIQEDGKKQAIASYLDGLARSAGFVSAIGEINNDRRPAVVVYVEGGQVVSVMADRPVRIGVVDFDCDGTGSQDINTTVLDIDRPSMATYTPDAVTRVDSEIKTRLDFMDSRLAAKNPPYRTVAQVLADDYEAVDVDAKFNAHLDSYHEEMPGDLSHLLYSTLLAKCNPVGYNCQRNDWLADQDYEEVDDQYYTADDYAQAEATADDERHAAESDGDI